MKGSPVYIFCVAAFFAVMGITAPANAQTEQERLEQYRQDEAQMARAQLSRDIDSAVYYMDAGEYQIADDRFREVLQKLKSVPSDFTFYFGKNSYYLGEYKQSIDWLNKYVELKGTSGRFYQEAIDLIKNAEVAVVQVTQRNADDAASVLSRNYDIDCGPTGKVICPVCKGSTVIIKHGAFGNEYTTCPYCDSHGLLTCAQYNELIRGELKPRSSNN